MPTLEDLLRATRATQPQQAGAANALGALIDAADDAAHAATISAAVDIADQWIAADDRTFPDGLMFRFFRANAYLALAKAKTSAGVCTASDWEQPDLEAGLLGLREVVSDPRFLGWPSVRRAQVHTNLGNTLSTLGRPIDALHQRDEALRAVPHFGMALGTRAETVDALGRFAHRRLERRAFLAAAAQGFAAALQPTARYESAYTALREKWAAREKLLRDWLDANGWPDFTVFDAAAFGEETPPLVAYVRWCLDHRLMLSIFNEIGPLRLAANDHLHLPPMRLTPISAELMAMFDAMMSELSAARWSLYESEHARGLHFSDVLLKPHDTGDAPCIGYHVERLKTALRMAYSVLDKIAFFVNAYWNLGMRPRAIGFASIWREKGIVRTELLASTNWPLRGLFFVSRDLFEDEFQGGLEPDARELAIIRNRLEHRYVRVVARSQPGLNNDDTIVYRVVLDEMRAKTLRLVQLSRTALIMLAAAVLHEERHASQPGTRYTRMARLRTAESASEEGAESVDG